MGLASVAENARHASSAIKAREGTARRGMFALIERRRSYMSLRDGHHAWNTYTPAIVSSVTRDGLAKEVRVAGQQWALKASDWSTIMIDSAGRIADPQAVAAALVDDNGQAIEYRLRAEALVAIKNAAGIGEN
jgi:hypothetical protein